MDEIDPGAHACELLLEDGAVAVELVHGPGQDGGHVAPDARARALHVSGRDDKWHHPAARGLFLRQVVAVLGEERGRVEVKARRPTEDHRVARPAEALVTLRAVGRDVDKVTLLAPQRVLEQAVDFRVRGLDLARAVQARMHDAAGEVVHIELADPARDLDVAEAEERERRLDDRVCAVGDVRVLGLRRAQVVAIEAAVLQHFTVLQVDARPGRRRGLEAQPADQVLAQVEYGFIGRGMQDRDRLEFLADLDRERPACLERAVDLNRPDAAHSRRVDARPWDSGIINFTIVDAALEHRRSRRLPGLVGADDDLLARVEREVQFSDQGETIAIGLRRGGALLHAIAALVPTVAEHDRDRMGARRERVGQVIRLILEPLIVRVAMRRENFDADFGAVEQQVIEAEAADIGARRDNAAGKIEALVERGVGLSIGKVGRDPLRLPGLVQLGRLEPGRRTFSGFGIAPDPDLPVVTRPRCQGERRRVAQAINRRALDAAGIQEDRVEARIGCDQDLGRDLTGVGRVLDDPGQPRLIQGKPERIQDPIGLELRDLHGLTLPWQIGIRLG